jgi:hypothetical protein
VDYKRDDREVERHLQQRLRGTQWHGSLYQYTQHRRIALPSFRPAKTFVKSIRFCQNNILKIKFCGFFPFIQFWACLGLFWPEMVF